MLEPAGPARREDRVREHAPRAGFPVHLVARLDRHLVGEEPVTRDVRRRRRDQRDLGVAVEIDFLEVVVELQVLEGLRLADQRRIPSGLADSLARADEILQPRVVTQEVCVHVHDELVFERVGALLRHRRRRGLGAARVENCAERVVQRDEARRHAGRALEELPSAEALLAAELVCHR